MPRLAKDPFQAQEHAGPHHHAPVLGPPTVRHKTGAGQVRIERQERINHSWHAQITRVKLKAKQIKIPKAVEHKELQQNNVAR